MPSSCGALLNRVRWQETLAEWRWTNRGPRSESDEVLQQQIMEQTEPSFTFAKLLPELQIEVVERLGYNDLKCLECVPWCSLSQSDHANVLFLSPRYSSLRMRRFLRDTHAKTLDATLFRSKVDLGTLAARQAAFESLLPEQRQSNGPVVFHPLVLLRSEYRYDLQIPVYLGDSWEEAKVVLSGVPCPRHDGVFAQTTCPARTLREGAENATEPPTAKLHFALWNQEWAAAITQIGTGNANDLQPFHVTLEASSEGSAVTLGQLMKSIFTTLELVKGQLESHGVKYMPVVPPNFRGWRTQYLADDGCLHLLNSKWAYGSEPWSSD